MESEKVKEIKEKLQEEIFIANSFGDKLRKVPTKELENLLTLINELESENERLENKNYQLEQNLGQCENGYKLELHTARYQLHSANEDLKKAQDRIAELEEYIKSNEQDAKAFVNGWHKDLETELKQFAERLKEELKGIVGANFIDETLKEFLNKGDDK